VTTPGPPVGFVEAPRRDLRQHVGEVARWRHAADVELSLRARLDEAPAHVHLDVWPRPAFRSGVTRPAELRQLAWALLTAARWLEHHAVAVPAEPDPQLTIYDELQEVS
jgi:hypothetical protein